jgi:hypothetical protein
VRVGNVWYWVDPAMPAGAIEPGDIVVVYPGAGDAMLAVLQSPFNPTSIIDFATLDGERFAVPASDIAALHLAAVDEDQS